MNSFKKIINDLKLFYEKQRYRWLVKHLIGYRKNKIREKIVKEREKKYCFENLDILIKNEGYNENIKNKMKEIILEVKNGDDLKRKIFIFIIKAIDFFRTCPEKFLKELDVILKQVKINFKEKVMKNVGNTEDVQKYINSENSSYYVANNNSNNKYVNYTESTIENNKIIKNKKKTNYIYSNKEKTECKKKSKKELELYNGFNVKDYGPKSLFLDISNTFIANNNNNNYYVTNNIYVSKNNKYTSNEIDNIYSEDSEDSDILKNLINVDKKSENISININISNKIKANNNNNNKEISNIKEVYENNNVIENIITNFNNHNNECKYKSKKEINEKKIDNIDILKNEIKKNLNEQSGDVYIYNKQNNYCKVNNVNNQKINKNKETIIKNTDIKINNENNYYKNEPVYNAIDQNENKLTNLINSKTVKKEKREEKEKKIYLNNKEVNIKITDGEVDKIEIKNKIDDEKKQYIKEESKTPKYRKISSQTRNRICNKCFKTCHENCYMENYLKCWVFLDKTDDICFHCGCHKDYHEASYQIYILS